CRRIRRQHGVRSCDPVELGEDLPLQLQVLEGGLDHEIAVGQIRQLRGQRQALRRATAFTLGQPSFLHAAVEVPLDRGATALRKLLADLAPDSVESGLHAHLRDTRAHRSQADDTDLLKRHAASLRAMTQRNATSPCPGSLWTVNYSAGAYRHVT